MDITKFFDKNEKPLDNLLPDAGFSAIFRKVGVVGDSLSSGEFEVLDANGVKAYHDFYEHSWGQYMARAMGSKVFNFSRGGMTAKEFCETFGGKCGAWEYENICDAYIIALGCNDVNSIELGTVDDIAYPAGYGNPETFAGYIGQIILRLKAKAPDAKFFLVSQPKAYFDGEGDDKIAKWKKDSAKLLHEIAERVGNAYVIDLYEYAPTYDDEFKDSFYLLGHLNPMGYLLTAKMMMTYIDYIIRHNMKDFTEVGLINTPYRNAKL